MTHPDPIQGLTFSEVPPLPDDAPDFTASADTPPPPSGSQPRNPPLTGEGEPARKRRLPGRGGPTGTRDHSSRTERARLHAPREPKPLPPIPAKGFAPGVEKMYHALALAVTPFDVDLGSALHEIAAEAAQAWDELARQNHAVRRLLVAMMETTAWGTVLAAHSPLIGLMFARMLGQKPRVSLMGMMMGNEAESFLNPNRDGETGTEAA